MSCQGADRTGRTEANLAEGRGSPGGRDGAVLRGVCRVFLDCGAR